MFPDPNNSIIAVAVPHRSNGWLRDLSSPLGTPGLYRPNGGKDPKQWGAQGGNLGYLDGSVIWKKIEQVNTHWTKEGGGAFDYF